MTCGGSVPPPRAHVQQIRCRAVAGAVTTGRVIVAVASFGQFVVAVVIDAAAAMLVFRHADKHGSRHATAWGLFTFLAAIVAIPAYVASYLLRTRRRG